jgi:hypothetical protein
MAAHEGVVDRDRDRRVGMISSRTIRSVRCKPSWSADQQAREKNRCAR